MFVVYESDAACIIILLILYTKQVHGKYHGEGYTPSSEGVDSDYRTLRGNRIDYNAKRRRDIEIVLD